MSWSRPSDITRGALRAATHPRTVALALPAAAIGSGSRPASAGLGAAQAGHQWVWSEPVRRAAAPARLERPALMETNGVPNCPGHVLVRVPTALLREMTRAARVAGRSEGELWAEAAREWLARRARGDEPLPPTPAAPALPVPRPMRAWFAIDSVMTDLRRTRRPERRIERVPAA